MEETEIINIIKTKDNWESNDLIKVIKEHNKNQINIKFCHIGGYELLRNGTKTETCKSLKDIQDILDDWEVDYDINITDPVKLAESVVDEWANSWDDGGGSGWIEF